VAYLAVCQNLVPLVNIKIAGKWMFIPLKMVLIGIDPYPFIIADQPPVDPCRSSPVPEQPSLDHSEDGIVPVAGDRIAVLVTGSHGSHDFNGILMGFNGDSMVLWHFMMDLRGLNGI